MHRTYTPYADTDVLQTLSSDVHLGQGSKKVYAVEEEQILRALLIA